MDRHNWRHRRGGNGSTPPHGIRGFPVHAGSGSSHPGFPSKHLLGGFGF